MIYKKITLKPKSGLITQLESDTVLGYVFAYNFEKLENIFDKFISGNPSFLISNAFIDGFIVKPIYFGEKNKIEDNFLDDINGELNRKKLKKINLFPMKKVYFEKIFNNSLQDLNNELLDNNYQLEKKLKKEINYKNSIKRFDKGETNPYFIENIYYNNGEYCIFVKVFNEDDFKLFFEKMKNTFESIGFGKSKSRGYGQFSEINLQDLNNDEKEVFDYLEFLEKEKNMKIVLNNFKANSQDLENINLEDSFFEINSKNTKSLYEFNKNVFKGQMNFIKEGSVLKFKNKLNGDFYKSNNSYNFGYIF